MLIKVFCNKLGQLVDAFTDFVDERAGILKPILLTLSWRRSLLYRNQSIDLLCKSVDWFLYDNGFRHERVNILFILSTMVSKSSTRSCSMKKCFLKIFTKFTGKQLYQILFCSKVVTLGPEFIRDFDTGEFSVNFATFIRKHFLQNTSGSCFWVSLLKLNILKPSIEFLKNLLRLVVVHGLEI